MIPLRYGYSPFLALLFRSTAGGLLAVSLLLSGAVLNGQEYYFKHYEVVNGLSHNTIHCATQDDRGFMWFGTKNGLNRFDGYQFDWYQSDEEVTGGIGSNFIECLDFANGLLWIGTDNGLYTGNPRTGQFELVAGTADQPILDVAHDAAGNVWFIAEGVLCRVGVAGTSVRKYQLPKQGPVRKIAVSPNDRISVATSTSAFLYQPAHEAFLPLPIVPVTRNDFPLKFSALYFLNESSLAVGTVNHGAFLYDLPNGSAAPILDKAENRLYVRDFLLRDNNLWIGTEDGVYIYNLSGGGTKHLTKDPVRPYALSDNAVYCIREDTHGGVWVGTYFRGLNYYSKSLTGFQKFLPVAGQNSVSGSAIREIVKDRSGFLWIGTEDAGLNRYDPEKKIFRHFPLKTFGEGIVARNVHGLLANGDELWAGTFQNGLFILDVNTGTIKRHLVAGRESGLKSNFIYTIGRTKDARIYALTSSGVHLYDQASEQFRVVSFFPEDYFYTSFLEDSDGGLWVGTYWDGLFYHHPERNESRAYGRKATDGKQLSNDAINGIFEDSRKNIWVSTENGLNLIKPGKKQVVRYDKKDGFPGNVFYSVLEDEKGKLWMSTTSGLVRFDPETGYIDQYTTENGLLANQFNYNSAYRADNGRMYFGGVKGFVSFAPYDVRFNQQPAPDGLVLTGLKINVPGNAEPAGGWLPVRGGDFTASVELAHFQSTFSISYSALDYNTPGLTRYRYQLEGLDDGWVDAGNANTIYFTALPQGDYTLRLKAKTNNSDWGLPTELLHLRITPPWWKSQWAYVLYAVLSGLCLFLLLWSYHRYSREKQRQQLQLFDNEKQKDIYQAKIDFFTNVSHEILTPLTLIKMPIEKLLTTAKEGSKVKANLRVVHRNTTRLVNLVEQLLDFRKTEMDNATLSFVRVDLRELLEDTKERFQSAVEDKGLVLSLAPFPDPVLTFIDVEAVRKILDNLFQNAIKYGDRQVHVSLTTTDKEVLIAVKNDGPLIPITEGERIFQPFYRLARHGSHPGTGIGLSLAYSLAELHHGKLLLDTADPEMNAFVLQLPLFSNAGSELASSTSDQAEIAVTAMHTTPGLLPRPTILLVEDNLDLLDFVARDLLEDYPVLKATNGEEAMELLKTQPIRLVISDVMMPGMDGFELCRRIKTDLKMSHLPIILLTSRNSLNAEISGLEAGADAYITKPFSMPYLKTRVSNLLENRKHIVNHFSTSPLAHLQSIDHSPVDDSFLRELDEVIHANISDPELNVEQLAERLHMSRSTLYRKVKDLSGTNPNELINTARLKKAAGLLTTKRYRIYEIAEMVGYNSATSFGRNFQKQFGMSPSAYLSSKEGNPSGEPSITD